MKLSVSFGFVLWNERQKRCWKQEFFLTAPEGGLTEEISYRTQTSSILLPPPLICSFSDPWGFLTIQEPKRKEKKKGGGGDTRHKAWVFNTSFQTLLAGLILLLFGLLWYFLSSFMDPWGLFTCDITETLSSQDCVYPVQTSLIVFYLLQESNTPKSLVVFRLPLTCLGVPIQGKCAKAKTASA